MIVKIVCASNDTFSKLYQKEEGEYLIGVDGGAKILIKNRLPIDLAIGDFDSSQFNEIKAKSKNVILYPPNKDKSDLELTLNYIFSPEFQTNYNIKKRIDKIIIYNATGRRLDHYRATMNLLVRYMHLPIEVLDNHNYIYIVNSKTTFTKSTYRYISFFAIDPNTTISLKGFKYDLQDHELGMYDNLCLSNEIKAEQASLVTNNKKVMVIQSN